MKIPTVLGFATIITLMALGGLYYYYSPKEETSANYGVADIKVVNITSNSATVVWQTNMPSVGGVFYNDSEQLSQKAADSRDRGLKRARMVHFANLSNLKPGTKYLYKVTNDEVAFPDQALGFETAKFELKQEDEITYSFLKPLKGTVLNTNLNPVDESLVFLEIPGAQSLGTFSSTAGNFVLPLKTVLSTNLDKLFLIPEDTQAALTVLKGSLRSEVKVTISDNKVNLPPIPVGSNLDLTNFEPQPFNKITFSTIPTIGSDFNGDQIINSLDLAILREAAGEANSGSVNTQSNFDINKDGIVDQDDVNEFAKSLTP